MNCYFKYIMLVVASVFALSSCEEKDVEVYGNEAYLVFEMPGYGLNNKIPCGLKLVLSGNRFRMTGKSSSW